MGSPSVEELYETCSGADDGPWRQGEVLQGSRVKLENGFECTKESPTSVPTTQEESSFMRCRSARAGEELETLKLRQTTPSVRGSTGSFHGLVSWARFMGPLT